MLHKIVQVAVRHNGPNDVKGRRISLLISQVRAVAGEGAIGVEGLLIGWNGAMPIKLVINQDYFYAGGNVRLPDEWDYSRDARDRNYTLVILRVEFNEHAGK